MNCKQGDLAIIVRSAHGNEGKIVRCLELLFTDMLPCHNGPLPLFDGLQHVWRVDRPVRFGPPPGRRGYVVDVEYCADAVLRPLRGDLTEDELHKEREMQ